MAEIDTEKLRKIIAEIDTMLEDETDHAAVIGHLVATHDGVLNTSGATNTLRVAGVTGSCAHSFTTGLLASWRRNAEKRTGHGRNTADNRVKGTDNRLILLLERIERIREEKKGCADDERDVFSEGKAVGYDVKMMRELLKLRAMKPDDRAEMDMLLDTYRSAAGID